MNTDGKHADLAIGRQTVHIGRQGFDTEVGYIDRGHGIDEINETAWKLAHWTCSSRVPDSEVLKWYSQPMDESKLDKSAIKWEFRRFGKDPECYVRPHAYCRGFTEPDMAENHLDLRWLLVSKKFRHEASKLLFNNHKFDFDRVSDILLWISAVPPEFRPYIRHIRLTLNFNASALSPTTRITEWSLFFVHVMPSRLSGLTSLDLVINLNSFASCWSLQPAAGFQSVFLPLRSLKNLASFTVIINELGFFEGGTRCDQLMHADDCVKWHQGHSMEKFWERKEIRRKMADKIMEMVLHKKDNHNTENDFPV